MLDQVRSTAPALSRTVATAALALTATLVPGSTAHAAPVPAPVPTVVVAGFVLRPAPPVYVLPVRGYRLTGEFGDSNGPWRSGHTGLDFAAPSGTPIRSVAAGRVVSSGYDGRYGNKTVVRLADGTELWYCHQSSSEVSAGDRVKPGQVIGSVGSTGNVTGPHLHLEVRPRTDRPVDPARWFRTHRVAV